jgi:hypothetical protein
MDTAAEVVTVAHAAVAEAVGNRSTRTQNETARGGRGNSPSPLRFERLLEATQIDARPPLSRVRNFAVIRR